MRKNISEKKIDILDEKCRLMKEMCLQMTVEKKMTVQDMEIILEFIR